MEGKPGRIHPLVAIAAVSVTVASLAAVATLTGFLPGSAAEPTPPAPVAAVEPAAASKDAAATVAPQATPPKPAPRATAPRTPAAAPAKTTTAALPPPPPPPVCHNCGTVESVREVVQQGQGTGLGAVAGGVLGGVLGHQVGSGRGNDAATVIGAVGGAVAGHQVEKAQRKSVHYEISVRMDNGSRQSINAKEAPVWREGDRVKLVDGALAPAGQAY